MFLIKIILKSFFCKFFIIFVITVIIILVISIIYNEFFYNKSYYAKILKEINLYVKDCYTSPIDHNQIESEVSKPEISIIIPVYNSLEYIEYSYKSIIKQSFKKIEIIYVNDFPSDASKDNEIIKNLQKKDLRIILIKNKKNMGPFYSRNAGFSLSKGKYIQFLDSDDLLINDILDKSLNYAQNDDLDIIQFPYIKPYGHGHNLVYNLSTTNGIIHQPELKTIMTYANGKLVYKVSKYMIWDKLIKNETYHNAMKFLGDEYMKERFDFVDNFLISYALINVANSYLYIDEPGYFYHIGKRRRITYNRNSVTNSNNIFRSTFTIIKFIYEKNGNNKNETNDVICFFTTFNSLFWSKNKKIRFDNETINIVNKVFNLLSNNDLLEIKYKQLINNVEKQINKKMKQSLNDIEEKKKEENEEKKDEK